MNRGPELFYTDPSDPFPFKEIQLKDCIKYLNYLKSADDIIINNLRSEPILTCFGVLFKDIQTNTPYEIPIIRNKIQEAIIQVELKIDQEAKANSTKQSDIPAEPKVPNITAKLPNESFNSEHQISKLMATNRELYDLINKYEKISEYLDKQFTIITRHRTKIIEHDKLIDQLNDKVEQSFDWKREWKALSVRCDEIEMGLDALKNKNNCYNVEMNPEVQKEKLLGMIKSADLDEEDLKFDRNLHRIENSDLDVIKKKQKLNEEIPVQVDSNSPKQVESYTPILVRVERINGKLDFDHFGSSEEFVQEDLEFIVKNLNLKPVDKNAKKEDLIEEVMQGCKTTNRVIKEVKQIIIDN